MRWHVLDFRHPTLPLATGIKGPSPGPAEEKTLPTHAGEDKVHRTEGDVEEHRAGLLQHRRTRWLLADSELSTDARIEWFCVITGGGEVYEETNHTNQRSAAAHSLLPNLIQREPSADRPNLVPRRNL